MQNNQINFFVIAFLLFLSCLGSISVSSNNDLTEGKQFMYKVNNFSVDIKINNTETKFDSFSIAGSNNITSSTSDAVFNITYKSSNSNSVSYIISKGTFNENATVHSDNIFASSVIPQSSTPTLSNLSLNSNDIALFSFPFILPVSGKTDQLWTKLDNETFKDSSASLTQSGLSISSSVKSKITSDKFEVNTNVKESGSLLGQQINTQITSNVVYELATGVLLGYKSYVSMASSILGTPFTDNSNIEITRQDYHFGSSGLFGFDTFSMIFSMFIVSVLLLKFRKNKIN